MYIVARCVLIFVQHMRARVSHFFVPKYYAQLKILRKLLQAQHPFSACTVPRAVHFMPAFLTNRVLLVLVSEVKQNKY